jgi:signal transduction histidine kinase
MTDRRRASLAGRHALALCALLIAAVVLALALDAWLGAPWLAGVIALLMLIPLAVYSVQRAYAPMLAMFRALAGTVTSYRDGDFAFSLRWHRNDEMRDLVDAHNALGEALRAQRQDLAQRELLLDTMVQNTPVAMMLCRADRVVYGNLAARRLLNGGRRLEGHPLGDILAAAPALAEAVARGGDGLFAVQPEGEDEEETYHLARRPFRLNGRAHELYLLRYVTPELRRQEVRTWKKVIRVISHELNNSLAPMASLAHSGGELVRRGRTERLAEIFATIEDRARHLESFIKGYARFAKLPTPNVETVLWPGFVERLRSQVDFTLVGSLPESPGRFDPAQLEQALQNLLRNAHESGSAPEAVTFEVRPTGAVVVIEVADRGPGMSDRVLSSALLPFYSEKRGGTGLGLALAREIAEAHGGHIALTNRTGGGLSVSMTLPA